jgi:DNA invertase Pin-like site-specific DNA recombinase
MNPAHLFLGDAADNNRDMMAKGRGIVPKGEEVWASKLTESNIIEIRKLYSEGETQRAIAPKFGVDYRTISKIVRRERWKHVA